MSLLFLTYGSTHSGKTTFAKKLQAALGETAKFIRVDNDEVDEFVKANYGNLRSDKAILATRTPTNPDLRLLIPQLITGYALKEHYSVITTAAHPRAVIRQAYYDIARRNNAQVVLLMFEVDEARTMQRIRNAKRDVDLLDTSPHKANTATFEELYHSQKQALEPPTETEKQACLKVFTINHHNADTVLEEVIALAA